MRMKSGGQIIKDKSFDVDSGGIGEFIKINYKENHFNGLIVHVLRRFLTVFLYADKKFDYYLIYARDVTGYEEGVLTVSELIKMDN